MADEADLADEQTELWLGEALRRARAVKNPPPSPDCLNCDEPLEGRFNFCDAACRDDWETRQAALRLRGTEE